MSAPMTAAFRTSYPRSRNCWKVRATRWPETCSFPNEMEDFSPIAAKLNAIKDADAVFVENGSPIAVGNITKGLRSLGNKKPIVYQGLSACSDIMAVAGKDAANDIITMGLTPRPKATRLCWTRCT